MNPIKASLQKGLRMLLFGFNRTLRPYEDAVLQMVMLNLAEEDRITLNAQIAARERIQRWNQDRMVIFGFADRARVSPISYRGENYCLARVILRSGRGKVSAEVMMHRGVLSSLEFSKSPEAFRKNDHEVESLKMHARSLHLCQQLDGIEHEGSEPV